MIPMPLEDGVCGICLNWLPEEHNYVYYSRYRDLERPGCCPQLTCCAQNVHGGCLIKELVRQCPDWGKGHGCVSVSCPFCSEQIDQTLACEAVCTELMYKISLMSGGLLEAFKTGEMKCTLWTEVKQESDVAKEASGSEERTPGIIERYWPSFSFGLGRAVEEIGDTCDSQLEADIFDFETQSDWECYGTDSDYYDSIR